MSSSDKPLEFAVRAEWRAWLEKHHAEEQAAWLRLYKKRAAKACLTLEEAVEEALCFGWIDGLLRRSTAESYILRFSPRKTKSIWSETNKQRAEKLLRQGRMTAAGLEKIAAAKASGEWDAATAREDVHLIPIDLKQALKTHQTAWRDFQALPASRKKQYLYWLASAKRPETRQKRIQAIIERVGSEPVSREQEALMEIRYPEVGVCGLSCRLCPHYHTDGESRCIGCKGEMRMAVGCPFITCAVKRKGIEFCWQCEESGSCKRWAGHRESGRTRDTFVCYAALEDNITSIERDGLEGFIGEQRVREGLLREMLVEFNEGRSKTYYCVAATVLDPSQLQSALKSARETATGLDLRAKSKVLHALLDAAASAKSLRIALRK